MTRRRGAPSIVSHAAPEASGTGVDSANGSSPHAAAGSALPARSAGTLPAGPPVAGGSARRHAPAAAAAAIESATRAARFTATSYQTSDAGSAGWTAPPGSPARADHVHLEPHGAAGRRDAAEQERRLHRVVDADRRRTEPDAGVQRAQLAALLELADQHHARDEAVDVGRSG